MIAHSDSIAKLAADYCKAQSELTNPAKDAVAHIGAGRDYTYALLSSIGNHTRPVLAKHNLSITQHVNGEPGVLRVTTVLLHASGEYLSSDAVIGLPNGCTPQQLGSAVTYLRRYGIQAVLGIAADDDDDGAAASQAPHSAPPVTAKAQPPAAPKAAPAASQAAPRAPQAAQSTTTFTSTVVDVATKSGTTSAGRDWTVYRAKFDNGTQASTFDHAIGNTLQAIAGTGEGVMVEVKPSKDGKGTDIVNIAPLGPPDDGTDDESDLSIPF
jgi:hypothetical protein